jgi:DNA polymerase V
MTITGLRTWYELQGNSLISIEAEEKAKKNICTSRSFGSMLSNYSTIEEALSNYAARCGEKLRFQKSAARQLTVFLHTNEHRKDLGQYAKNILINLPVPTNSSIDLIKYARKGLSLIFKDGFKYKKVGVIVCDFVPEEDIQQNLFALNQNIRQASVMRTMDIINSKLGSGSVKIGAQGFSKKWMLRQEKLSPCYSTRLSDIITIKV